jgi:hypothetical protein
MHGPPRLAGFDAPTGRKFLLVTSLLVATQPSTLISAWLRWQGGSIVHHRGGALKGAAVWRIWLLCDRCGRLSSWCMS